MEVRCTKCGHIWETTSEYEYVTCPNCSLKMKPERRNGLIMAECLKIYPELNNFPEFNVSEYANSGENIFEMISKNLKDKIGLIAERNNRENKKTIDFKIINPKTKEIVCYCDMEADFTGAFDENGTFIYWDLTIPSEKKKYFFLDSPFFYIKYSGDFKWCYVLDGWASREIFNEVVKERNMRGIKIDRKLIEAKSSAIFNRNIPYAIHRCAVQDWLKAVAFFMKKRYSQMRIDDYEKKN